MNSNVNLVCFGGGTGMPALLSGLKHNPWLSIKACVNMFDNGGSSGELRDRFGILPPGDILKCLLALSDHEGYARQLLQKRISNHAYDGHTAGNILLLGLEKVFEDYLLALDALQEILSVRGKVIPITLEKSALCANYTDGSQCEGEVNVDKGIREGKVISQLFLKPVVSILADAREAIETADAFCIGPGSIYTSVLPNFLPKGVSQALRNTKGPVIYIANLLTEGKGMRGTGLEDAVVLVENYIGRRVDHVIANNLHPPTGSDILARYASEDKYPIVRQYAEADPRFIFADLWLDHSIARHDSARLAYIISSLL